MSEKTTVQLLLEQRFQQLAKEQRENNEVPAELRQEVFRTLDKIERLGEETERKGTPAELLDTTKPPKGDAPPPADQEDA